MNHLSDAGRVSDLLSASRQVGREVGETSRIKGWGFYELHGPDGRLKQYGVFDGTTQQMEADLGK